MHRPLLARGLLLPYMGPCASGVAASGTYRGGLGSLMLCYVMEAIARTHTWRPLTEPTSCPYLPPERPLHGDRRSLPLLGRRGARVVARDGLTAVML